MIQLQKSLFMKDFSPFLTTGKFLSFVDTQLAQLRKQSKKAKKSAYAQGTLSNLKLQWRSYLSFCHYFDIEPLPAASDTLCIYAQLLSRSFKSTDTIRNYISGVKLLHSMLDFPTDSFSSFELRLALRGLARLKPHCPKQAHPMTPSILCHIHDLLDLSNPVQATMWALCLTSFYTLARKSNLVVTSPHKFDSSKQLCRQDVQIGSKGLLFTFRWPKTIQFGQRSLEIPVLSIPSSKLCLLSAYKNMLHRVQSPQSGPAFALPSVASCRPVSYTFYQKFIKTCVQQIGLNPADYSSHSFRRGGATLAFKTGVPSELIKVQGDWRSQAYLRYLDFTLEQRVLVSKLMADHIVKG